MEREILGARVSGCFKSLQRFLAFCLIVILAAGCTTMNSVTPLPKGIEEKVKPGDRVRITTMDNLAMEFQVKEITEQRIVGESSNIAFADIRWIERQEFSTGKTIGLVAGILGGAAVITAISLFTFAYVVTH